MSKWTDTTEVVAGAVIAHQNNPIPDEHVLRIPLAQVRPEIFAPPYDQMIKSILKGSTKEELVQQSIASFQTGLTAVRNLNGTSEGIDWVSMLERSAAEYQAGQELDRFSKKLMRGNEVDWTKITEIASKVNNCEDVNAYTPLSEISREKPAFIETGFVPVDTHLGGIPSTGLTTVLGTPGIGKTTFAVALAASFAKAHPDKVVAFHTMEMLSEEISKRFDEVEKLPKDVQNRILIRDVAESSDKILAKASTVENLGLIICDFAEYMVEGEITEAAMTYVFKSMATGSKNLRVPAVLLAQVSKSNYQGGIPKPHHVYYTDAAQKFSWMFISLYNPNIVKHY